jgi:hypothetical protein
VYEALSYECVRPQKEDFNVVVLLEVDYHCLYTKVCHGQVEEFLLHWKPSDF